MRHGNGSTLLSNRRTISVKGKAPVWRRDCKDCDALKGALRAVDPSIDVIVYLPNDSRLTVLSSRGELTLHNHPV